MNTKFSIIVAADLNFGIGINNTLPWRIPSELKYFQEITTSTQDSNKQNAVIMGRKTWDSLPSKSKPLANRLNIVVSRNPQLELPAGVLAADSLERALAAASANPVTTENSFLIGGAQMYAEGLKNPDCQAVYLTRIQQVFECDAFFDALELQNFKLDSSSESHFENGFEYKFEKYVRNI